jgi:hypothetical protein
MHIKQYSLSVLRLGYWLDDGGQRNLSLLQNLKTVSGIHPASCSVGTDVFPGGKVDGHYFDDHSPFNAEVRNQWSCTSTFPVYVHGKECDNFLPFHLHPGSPSGLFPLHDQILISCLFFLKLSIKCTWITPPPQSPEQARNSLGRSNSFPSQSIIITSSSVQAGLVS